MKKRRQPLKLSVRKKLLFSVVATVVFLGLAELLLAGLGIRPEASTTDRMVGFSSYSPLFVESTDADGQTIMATAPNKLHWFNQQSFVKQKSPATKRVFCMGGSTTYGHPYWDETSFAGWLRQYLPVVDPEHSWEVINAGGISYGSYRVAALMEELAQYQPDLFIVYSAHNEFLERQTYSEMFEQPVIMRQLTSIMSRTRIWTVAENLVASVRRRQAKPARDESALLPAEVDEELNHTVGPVDYHRDDAWHANVLASYKSNLSTMVEIAKRSGAKIVFIMPASNEKDCAPFKSEMAKLREGQLKAFQQHMSDGDDALAGGKFEAADHAYTQALQMDEHYADAHYQLGRVRLNQQRMDDALVHFRLAIDEDVCPLRATSQIEDAVGQVCSAQSVPLVDFQKRLRQWTEQRSGTSILGNEQFLDHVHPTIEVNRELAVWIIEDLQKRRIVGGTKINSAELQLPLEEIRNKVLTSIDREDEIFALRNLAKVLHWSGKFAEAIPRARDVLELAPDDAESRYIVACCLANLGLNEEALEEYDLLFADGIGYPRAYLPYGELLAACGQLEQAKAYLLLAILRSPDNATTYESLAEVHRALGETKFAEEAMAKANELRSKVGKK